MYKLGSNGMVMRLLDNAGIPPDPSNADYQEYLDWVKKGNKPKPADKEPEPETSPASILRLLLEDVTDVDETKPILDAMLQLLGG